MTTLAYLALTPVALYVAATTAFLSDSGQHLEAVTFLILAALVWPLTCLIAAVLPWFLQRRPRWRWSVLALPILYPLLWFFLLYPLAFALD